MALRRSGSTMDSTRAVGKAAVKALKKAEKAAAKEQKKARSRAEKQAEKTGLVAVPVAVERPPLSSAQLKRLIGLGTTVLPLLAPYALAAATAARGRWDAHRAARLGVTTDQLTAFSGPGGALHARLSHLAEALTTLEAAGGADDRPAPADGPTSIAPAKSVAPKSIAPTTVAPTTGAAMTSTAATAPGTGNGTVAGSAATKLAAAKFAEVTRPRLTDLAVAVRAAEQMPASRRRTAFRAVSGELDTIELTLLQYLGVAAG